MYSYVEPCIGRYGRSYRISVGVNGEQQVGWATSLREARKIRTQFRNMRKERLNGRRNRPYLNTMKRRSAMDQHLPPGVYTNYSLNKNGDGYSVGLCCTVTYPGGTKSFYAAFGKIRSEADALKIVLRRRDAFEKEIFG